MSNTAKNKHTRESAAKDYFEELIIKSILSSKPNLKEGDATSVELRKVHKPRVRVEQYKMNNIRHIDKHLTSTNTQLRIGEYYMIRVQFLEQWKQKRTLRNLKGVGLFFRGLEFLFLRAAPKVWGIQKVYFGLTKGKNRLISKAEALGRLISNGFDISRVIEHDDISYILVKKKSLPVDKKPSYGPLFKMNRIGKNGKVIGVYKLRTMHPYSEFLQEYLIEQNGYADTGKIKDDFRTTVWSRRLRKYWIDEIPQLLNVLKGDMKLVGVRPVSEIYFSQIPQELQELRKKYKPGCIPPYVAFNKSGSVRSVLECELTYLKMKEKDPYFTDTKLFFKAIFNIVFRGKRSA